VSFSDILGQESAKKLLKQVMAIGKIPHAYLFTGIRGIGKTSMAVAMAMALNCHEPVDFDSCGNCSSCRKIMAGNSPDFISIKPDGQHIKIEQIRDDLNRKINFAPLAKYRVCVVNQAETMTDEAANSFLKLLEEPPPGNIFILNAKEQLDLLETIVSRCRRVSFHPLPVKGITDWLVKNRGIDREVATLSAGISGGSLGRAIKMQEGDFFEKRQKWLLRLIRLPALSKDECFEMAVNCADEAKKIGLAVSESGESGIMDALSVWETWFRDLLLVKIGSPTDLLINVDFSHKLKKIAESFSMANLIDSLFVVDQAGRDLLRMQNITLVIEHTVLKLKQFTG